jgi:hypothetical protein
MHGLSLSLVLLRWTHGLVKSALFSIALVIASLGDVFGVFIFIFKLLPIQTSLSFELF